MTRIDFNTVIARLFERADGCSAVDLDARGLMERHSSPPLRLPSRDP
jgi:hypothetical protein